MKLFRILGVALLACSTAAAAEMSIEVANPSAAARPGEIVSLPWAQVQARIDGINAKNARVIGPDGAAVTSQAVDNDGDGSMDELLFAATLGPNQTARFKVVKDATLALPQSEERTYARYVPERDDDFAWENDVVAFRAYGPGLAKGVENSGIDCFMKRVKYPVVDGWYKGEKLGKSYHLDYGEGLDAYKVGSSLGCGGTAVWYKGKLYMSNVYRQWKQFSNGPLRSSFQLSYGPWEVGGKAITEVRRITIELGKRLFKVDDSIFADGKPARLDVAVGLATHEGAATAYEDRKQGWLYCWEKIDGYGLGTGVVVDPAVIKDYKLIDSKKKYQGNAFFVADSGDDGRFTYYAGYGWEKANEIKTREQWEGYLKSLIENNASPVKVSIK